MIIQCRVSKVQNHRYFWDIPRQTLNIRQRWFSNPPHSLTCLSDHSEVYQNQIHQISSFLFLQTDVFAFDSDSKKIPSKFDISPRRSARPAIFCRKTRKQSGCCGELRHRIEERASTSEFWITYSFMVKILMKMIDHSPKTEIIQYIYWRMKVWNQ